MSELADASGKSDRVFGSVPDPASTLLISLRHLRLFRQVLGRALILLHSHTETTNVDLLSGVAGLDGSVLGKSLKKGPPSAVQRLQKLMRMSKQTGRDFQMDQRQSRDQQLLAFIQDERMCLAHWLDFVQKRRLLGRRRLYALQCFEVCWGASGVSG